MRSRTRLVAVIASLLVCIAMIGTGFASWVILATETAESSGNVTAEAINDEGITLTVTQNPGDILYGSPAEMKAVNAWLVEDQQTGQGKFSVDIEVTVQGNIESLKVAFGATGEAFNTAVSNGYIAQYPTYSINSAKTPTGSISNASDIEVTPGDDGSATFKFGSSDKTENYKFDQETVFTVTVTFGWGTAFNGKNPYDFFNDGKKTALGSAEGDSDVGGLKTTAEWSGKQGVTKTDTWGDIAKGVLNWMATNLKDTDISYKFTFTATQAV